MNFDRLAPHYDWLEAVTAGDRLQRARTAFLGDLMGCRRILSVGEGHGRFADACAARWPAAELTCLDASAGMLAQARRKPNVSRARVTWIHADLLAWPTPAQPFDAIVTCFFLDCFPPGQLDEVVNRLGALAAPGARWLQVDFRLPAGGPAHWRARAVHVLMYAFFRGLVRLPAARLTAPDPLLSACGFRLMRQRNFEWGLVHAQLWQRET